MVSVVCVCVCVFVCVEHLDKLSSEKGSNLFYTANSVLNPTCIEITWLHNSPHVYYTNNII